MPAVKEARAQAFRLGLATPPQRFRDTPAGCFFGKLFLSCASLKLAIVLLSLFTACLALATILESSYSAHIAQDLVYHTWWFTLLLFLLAVNILCAALKKFPWKRHQIGFLITHLGLIVLVFGGLLTNLGGVEGQMMMLDSDNSEIQQAFRLANRSDTLQLVNRHQIEVYRLPKEKAGDNQLGEELVKVVNGGIELTDSLRNRLEGHQWALRLSPGSFAWHRDDHFKPQLPVMVRLLSAFADPFPGFSHTLDDHAKLVVENFYPHTERWPFAPAGDETEENVFPALQLKLTTPMTPRPFKRWISSLPSFESDPTPIAFEMFTLYDPALIPEFLEPPSPKELGKNGQLVVAIGFPRKLCRVSLDKVTEGDSVDLKGTGLKLTLKKRGQLMDVLGHKVDEPRDNPPQYPAVLFEISGEGGTGTYVSCARMPNLRAYREGSEIEGVTTWYHHPDFRWGQAHKMGALQYLKAPDGRVYYRIYGKDGLRQSGRELDTSTPGKVVELPFKPMDMKCEVLTWLPQAVRKDHIVPVNVRPGADPAERYEPALRCALHNKGEAKEFWVRMSRAATQVNVGKEMFFVRYRMDTRRVDFSVTLKRARQLSDPGTSRAAAFESEVALTHKQDGKDVSRDFTISMNHTLDHGGFKVYQTSYQPMTEPQSGQMVLDTEGRLVSMSGFTVADDPGLFFKYLGSLLLVLGIATMFYMRAYFFKPRRPAETPLAA